MLQTLRFPAGGRIVNALATFFRYEEAAAEQVQTIRVRADGQDLGEFEVGDSVELPTAAKSWEIAPQSGTLVGYVRVGMGRVSSQRLTGMVQVIDGGRQRTLNGSAVAGRDSATAAAGNVPFVQLWNPTGSGRRAVIKSMVASVSAAGDVFAGFVTAQLTPGALMRQKLSSGTWGQTRIQVGAYGTGVWTANILSIWQQPVSPSIAAPIKFDEPIVVEPGAGFALALQLDGGVLRATFEAVEEVI